jgi:hypothetical protein
MLEWLQEAAPGYQGERHTIWPALLSAGNNDSTFPHTRQAVPRRAFRVTENKANSASAWWGGGLFVDARHSPLLLSLISLP